MSDDLDYVIEQSPNGRFRWRTRSGEGTTGGLVGGEEFATEAEAREAIVPLIQRPPDVTLRGERRPMRTSQHGHARIVGPDGRTQEILTSAHRL